MVTSGLSGANGQFQKWRRGFLLFIALLTGVGGSLTVLATAAGAATLSSVSISADSYIAGDTSATWTIGFTTSGSGALTAGNAVDIGFPSGFNVSGAVATLTSGFSNCTAGTTVFSGTIVIVPLVGSSCNLADNTAATLDITGLSPGFNQYARIGFSVGTYVDTTFGQAIDSGVEPTGGSLCETQPSPPYSGIFCDILASIDYSNLTSTGSPVTSGTGPIDPASPYSIAFSPTADIAPNVDMLALTGYTFAGWCTNDVSANPTLCTGGTHYDPAYPFTVTGNTTLYSQWTVADGAGTMSVSPTTVTASSTNNTLTFTYTADPGGVNNGEVDIMVPNGWSLPALSGSGCISVSTGTLGFNGQIIQVTGLTLAGGSTLTVTYGATSGGSCLRGDRATAQSSTGTATFTTSEMSTLTGTLSPIATSPEVTVNSATAPDGSGTIVVAPTSAAASSTGNTLVFTYTAATGGIDNGEVDITAPTGWSPPGSSAAVGCTTSSSGTLSFNGQTIKVSALTLAGGGTLTVTYGATSGGSCVSGDGATAQSGTGTATFTTNEMSTSSGSLSPIATSPQVTVNPALAADGSGSIVVTPNSVEASSTGKTLVFTYTAATGGMSNGEVDINVPAGWSPPGSSAAVGCTTSSGGTLSFNGQTIDVSALTLVGGGTLTVTYGATSGGSCVSGDGATAQSGSGNALFTTSEKSSLTGILFPLGLLDQASVQVTPPYTCAVGWDLITGVCRLVPTLQSVSPSTFIAGVGQLVTLTGTDFSTNSSEDIVTYGPHGFGSTCAAVTDISSNTLTCNVGTDLAGNETFYFDVTIDSVSSGPGAMATVQAACPANSILSGSSCIAMPGFYLPAGASQPQACVPGYFSNSPGAVSCTAAPIGTYVNSNGAESALSCPGSTTTLTEGSTSSSECLPLSGAPKFTSAATATFLVGDKGTFTIAATGSPTPTLTLLGALPSGITFKSSGNAQATLSGTPAAGTGGSYKLSISAANGLGTVPQTLTLEVKALQSFTSPPSLNAVPGSPFSFKITTSGYPYGKISSGQGTLPTWATLTDNGNGTATISGTPPYSGTFIVHLQAQATVQIAAINVDQSFSINVSNAAVTTSTSLTAPSSAVLGSEGSVPFSATVTALKGTATPTGKVSIGTLTKVFCQASLNASGVASCTLTPSQLPVGSYSVIAQYSGVASKFASSKSTTSTLKIATPAVAPAITGADVGGGKLKITSGSTSKTISPFSTFTGALSVTTGHVTSAITTDVVVSAAPGSGGPPLVNVYDGTGNLICSFDAFNPFFTGGVNLATGDVNGAGTDQIIATPGPGGGPQVFVYSCNSKGSSSEMERFFAYFTNSFNGVSVATATLPGNTLPSIITGNGETATPDTSFTYNSATGQFVTAPYPPPPTLKITNLSDSSCTGTSTGLSLNGCPNAGSSTLKVDFQVTGSVGTGTYSLTPGLCTSFTVKAVDSSGGEEATCVLAPATPGSTVSVDVSVDGASSGTGPTIVF